MINLEWLKECGRLQAQVLEGHARLYMFHLSLMVIFYLGVGSLIDLRSAGCVTCKARRIKCDEAKPTCNQCDRHTIPYDGYKIDLEFKAWMILPSHPRSGRIESGLRLEHIDQH
jgi:hypothetical protein